MSAIYEQRANEVLDGHLPFLQSGAFSSRHLKQFERRAKPRLEESLPARVWGIDSEDEVLSVDCRLENLSAAGLFLKMPWQLKLQSEISLVVRLINSSGAMAAIRGRVLRDVPLPDGSRGIAVAIREHKLL